MYWKLVIQIKDRSYLGNPQFTRKTPEIKDKLKIWVSGSAIWLETDLTTIVKKPSRPMPLKFVNY